MPEDLTVVVEADRSRIEARLAEIKEKTEALNAEKRRLAEEESGLEFKLLSSLKGAGSSTSADERSVERFEGLLERRSAEILAAIEKGGSPAESEKLLADLKDELQQRDGAREQQDRENEERLLRLVAAEKNTQLQELVAGMKNRFAARAHALEEREQRMVELLTAMQQDDSADKTRALLDQVRAEMEERERACKAREAQLLAASAGDDLRPVLSGMLARLSAIERHLAVGRVGRAWHAPQEGSEEPAATRRENALETARIDLAAKERSKPPTVKLGQKKTRRVENLLEVGGKQELGLDPAAIESVVRLRRRDLQYCHELQLRRQPGLAGKVAISATVAANGQVSRVEVSQNDTGSKSLGECMAKKIKRWRFPEPGEPTTVEIPWVFISN